MKTAKDLPDLGRESLVFHPSKVSWAMSQFVRKPPDSTARWLLYLTSAFIALSVLYTTLATVPVSIETRGALATEQAILPVTASENFRIAQIRVKANQTVKRGDVLIVAEEQMSDAEFLQLRKDAEELSKILVQSRNDECTHCLSTLKQFEDRRFLTRTKGPVRDLINPTQESLKEYITAYSQVQNFSGLTASIRRQIEVASGKLLEIKRRNAEKQLAFQKEQLQTEIVNAKTQLQEKRQSLDQQIAQTRDRLELKLNSFPDALEAFYSKYTLKSPMDAVVSHLKVSGPGEWVQRGTLLFELVPEHSPLIAELRILNKDISKVRKEMPVLIKLDALPDREWGVAKAKIDVIPIDLSNDSSNSGVGESAFYKVTAQLEKQSLSQRNETAPFKMGMTFNALIVTKYESIFMRGIRKILNLRDELLDESPST